MKKQIDLMQTVVYGLIVIGILLAVWAVFNLAASKSGPLATQGIAITGLALARRKKGIVLTTTLLTTIIFTIIVLFFILMIFAGISGEAGSTASGSFFSMFDSIIQWLPWVR